MTTRLTSAQALMAFLANQYSEETASNIHFGHGNVAGLGQAFEQNPRLWYYLFRNEQAMVQAACAFAKASFRLRTLVCTSSIGPGATNMVTGAATATINRLPVPAPGLEWSELTRRHLRPGARKRQGGENYQGRS